MDTSPINLLSLQTTAPGETESRDGAGGRGRGAEDAEEGWEEEDILGRIADSKAKPDAFLLSVCVTGVIESAKPFVNPASLLPVAAPAHSC
jgi:hypothetical protein